MKRWHISFNENGSEYTGFLVVTANNVIRNGENGFDADGVHVEIDEAIQEITEDSEAPVQQTTPQAQNTEAGTSGVA